MMRISLVFYFNYGLKTLRIACNGVKRAHKLKQILSSLNSLYQIEYETRQNHDATHVKRCRSAIVELPNSRISLNKTRIIVGQVRIFVHINVFVNVLVGLVRNTVFSIFIIISILKTFLGVVEYCNIVITFS